MSSREAIKSLLKAGWEIVRQGKGDHVILQRAGRRLIIPDGKTELSPGMSGKVRSYSRELK